MKPLVLGWLVTHLVSLRVVWEANGIVADAQFSYEHVTSGHHIKGPRLAHGAVAHNSVPVDFRLAVGESIVSVQRWLGESETLHALELKTNLGQVLGAGKPVGAPTIEAIPPHSVFVSLPTIRRVGNTTQSRLITRPTALRLKTCYAKLIMTKFFAEDVKEAYLEAFAAAVHEIVVLDRRAHVAVSSLIAALISLVEQARSQRRPGFRQGIYGLFITKAERMTELQRILADVQTLAKRLKDFQTTEMTVLAGDYATASSFLKEEILTTNCQRFIRLHATHPVQFFNTGAFDKLLAFLVGTRDVESLRIVARVHAHAMKVTVPEAMASCANRVALVRIAVCAGQHLVLLWLIGEAELDSINPMPAPLTLGSDMGIDVDLFHTLPVRELAERVVDPEARRAVIALLDRVISRRLFAALINQQTVSTLEQLDGLVRHITSVVDLRLFVDSMQHLPLCDQRGLATRAFQHALDEDRQLLLDVDAAVHFKRIVKIAAKRKLITASEADRLCLEGIRANIASASCILRLSRDVALLRIEMKSVQAAFRSIVDELARLRNNDYLRMRRQQKARLVSALSTLLFGFGGQAFRLLGDLVDLSKPVDLFTSLVQIDPSTIGQTLADSTAEFLYHQGVESALQSMGAEPKAFVRLVRDIAELDHRPRITDIIRIPGAPRRPTLSFEAAVLLSVRHQGRLRVHLLAARRRIQQRAQPRPQHSLWSPVVLIIGGVLAVVLCVLTDSLLLDAGLPLAVPAAPLPPLPRLMQ